MSFIKQDVEGEDNLKEEVIALRELLSTVIEKFKIYPNESLLELQQELKSLKSLIEQSFATTEEENDLIVLKNEILSTPDPLPPNFNLKCFTKNGIELLYYYRIGLFLNLILNAIDKVISEIYPNNIVTGLIKGTGIANLFTIKNDTLDHKIAYDCKKARNFYIKSKRTYLVYKDFPKPLVQIFCAKNVTANKLLKIKNDEIFENLVKEIKVVVDRNRNCKTYNYQSDSLKSFEESFIDNIKTSSDIITEVLRYTRNPSKPINEQITANPLFERNFK